MYIGPEKIIVVLVIALIVLGPERLPQVARQAGRAYREFRRVTSGLEAEVRDVFQEPIRQAFSESAQAKEAQQAQPPSVPSASEAAPPALPSPSEPATQAATQAETEHVTQTATQPVAQPVTPPVATPVATPPGDPSLN